MVHLKHFEIFRIILKETFDKRTFNLALFKNTLFKLCRLDQSSSIETTSRVIK